MSSNEHIMKKHVIGAAAADGNTKEIVDGEIPEEDVMAFGLKYSKSHPRYKELNAKVRNFEIKYNMSNNISNNNDDKHTNGKSMLESNRRFIVNRLEAVKQSRRKLNAFECIQEICKVEKIAMKVIEFQIDITQSNMEIIGNIIKELDETNQFTNAEKEYIQRIIDKTDN